MSPPSGEPRWSDMRVSDEERERVLAELRRHFTDGRLSFEELSSRLDKALDAKTIGELYAITDDLPHVGAPHPVLEKEPSGSYGGPRRDHALARRLRRIIGLGGLVLAMLAFWGVPELPGSSRRCWCSRAGNRSPGPSHHAGTGAGEGSAEPSRTS